MSQICSMAEESLAQARSPWRASNLLRMLFSRAVPKEYWIGTSERKEPEPAQLSSAQLGEPKPDRQVEANCQVPVRGPAQAAAQPVPKLLLPAAVLVLVLVLVQPRPSGPEPSLLSPFSCRLFNSFRDRRRSTRGQSGVEWSAVQMEGKGRIAPSCNLVYPSHWFESSHAPAGRW